MPAAWPLPAIKDLAECRIPPSLTHATGHYERNSRPLHCSHAPPVEVLKSNQGLVQALPGGYVGPLLRNGVVDATVSRSPLSSR